MSAIASSRRDRRRRGNTVVTVLAGLLIVAAALGFAPVQSNEAPPAALGGYELHFTNGFGETVHATGDDARFRVETPDASERAALIPLGDVDDDCSVDPCFDGLLCNALKRCQLPPKEGEECVFGDCAPGLRCSSGSNTCVVLPEEGEACLENRCASGARCESSPEDPEGTCVGLTANDEMCMGHSECASGYCPNGFCWPVPGLGDDCQGAGYCAPASRPSRYAR